MGDISVQTEDNAVVLHVAGEWSYDTLPDLKAAFLDAFTDAKPLRVDLADVVSVDVAFFQLLHAAGREAGALGLTLEIIGELAPAIREGAERSGFAGPEGFELSGAGGAHSSGLTRSDKDNV